MKVTVYRESYDTFDSLAHFLDTLYSSQMRYFASDLLKEGLSLNDIQEGVRRAMLIAESADLNIRKHFMPVYSQLSGGIVKDCRMSRLGYALVLMNANPRKGIVGQWQVKVLQEYLNL